MGHQRETSDMWVWDTSAWQVTPKLLQQELIRGRLTWNWKPDWSERCNHLAGGSVGWILWETWQWLHPPAMFASQLDENTICNKHTHKSLVIEHWFVWIKLHHLFPLISFFGILCCVCVCVCIPVYEGIQQCVLTVVQLQQVGGQTQIAAERLPLNRTWNYIRTVRKSQSCDHFFIVSCLQLPSKSAGGVVEFR